jgi:1,2-diacylglycerol 3-alpha-glucosyltransferase
MLKIALLFTNYGPYHLARVSEFQQKCQKLEWIALGIELGRYEEEYPWETTRENINFDICSVINEKAVEQASLWTICKYLYSTLSQSSPDVIIDWRCYLRCYGVFGIANRLFLYLQQQNMTLLAPGGKKN